MLLWACKTFGPSLSVRRCCRKFEFRLLSRRRRNVPVPAFNQDPDEEPKEEESDKEIPNEEPKKEY